jgi:hypothetical protein
VPIGAELEARRGALRTEPLDDRYAVPWGWYDEGGYQSTECGGEDAFSSLSDNGYDGCCLAP